MSNNKIYNTLRSISETGYAEILTEAGFRSYHGDKINWFFLHQDVLWRLHLLPIGSSQCLVLALFYGAHPLYFRSPVNPPLPYAGDLGYVLHQGDYRITNPECFELIPQNKLYVLNTTGYGSSSLQRFYFPWFHAVTTPELAFAQRWEELSDMPASSLALVLKPDLVDELIWFEARKYYDAAIQATEINLERQYDRERMLSSQEVSEHLKRNIRKYMKLLPEVDELKKQLSVLRDGGEQEYKKQMQERAESFKKSLNSLLA